MSNSFTNQTLVALGKNGVVLTKLTQAQADCLNVPVEDPYKPEHYRYKIGRAALPRSRNLGGAATPPYQIIQKASGEIRSLFLIISMSAN